MKRALAAILSVGSSTVSAQVAMPDTVVTASRTSEVTLSIIEAAAIERLQPTTLLEVLDRAPGVRAFSKGGAGGTSYLSLQGGEPNYTLVLMDGVRLNDPTNSQGGSFDFSQLAPSAVERVEIATGGLSAVQGSDALSGVVHLRLRTPVPGERSVSLGAGADSERGRAADASAGYGWRGGGVLASGSWYDSGHLTPESDLRRSQAVVRVAHDTGDLLASAFVLHAGTDRSAFPEDSGGPRLAVLRERETRDTRLTVAAIDLAGSGTGAFQPHAAVRWTQQDADVATPAIAPGVYDGVPAIISNSQFERLDLVADVRGTVGRLLTLAAGAEYVAERGRSDGTVDFGMLIPAGFDIDRSIASGFVEATIAPSNAVALTAGLRLDDPTDLDANWSARGRVALRPVDDGPLLFAGVSEGFKLPSLYALAFPLIANPALKPERGTSTELGLEHALGSKGQLRVVAFRNRFRDMIDFDPQLFTNVNRDEVDTQGYSVAVAAQPLPGVRASANVTYTDVDSPTPLRSRPTWQGAFAVVWVVRPDLEFDLGGRFNDSYLDSSVPTGLVTADGHVEVDVGVRWQANPRVALSLVTRNVLAAEYEDAVGFPAAGRVVRLAARINL